MFGSDILEIALGLVLIYLLLSLILTAVQESLENILKTRAKNLERSIGELLQGNATLIREFYKHPLVYALYKGEYDVAGKHKRRKMLPSYIPRETFAAVLLDLHKRHDGPGRDKLDALMTGFAHLAPGSAKLRREVESWFDGAMDRASGWYKRHTQLRLFLIGLAISLLLNVNSISIANYLATNPQQRALVTAMAERAAQNGNGETLLSEVEQRELTDQLDKLGLPIGWEIEEWTRLRKTFPPFAAESGAELGATLRGLGILVTFLIGYLITAFAVMLGAPFWFDILNRIMVIRATVKPKEKSPDEPSEDGGQDRLATAPAGAKSKDGAAAAG